MAFAIEVPAETNPLTENLLIHVLRSASSSDPQQIQTGTKQLQQWERSEHFYVHLQSAYLDKRLPLELRYLAIIQLKNGIEKYWRKTAQNAVSKDDKSIIRSRLVDSILNEQENRLALQGALVVAKIARFEFPNDWPDVISSIIACLKSAVQSGASLTTSRALLLLLHVTKELSTGRLMRTRQNLQAVTPELVHAVGSLYAELLASVLPPNDIEGPQAQACLTQSLIAIKLVRRLLVFGYEHPNRNEDVISFWQLAIKNLGICIQLLKQGNVSRIPHVFLEKHVLQISKLHHEMARDHPAAFVLLPDSLDIIPAYWTMIKELGLEWLDQKANPDGDVTDYWLMMEKFALRGMLVIRACVKMVWNPTQTFKYKHAKDKEERSEAVELIKTRILSQEFIREVMNIVVTQFFVFRPGDLEEWEDEPEEWEKRGEAEGEDWEFSLRPCAEKLFLDLAINYKGVLIEPLVQAFQKVCQLSNEDVWLKDSIYTAVGLAAPVLVEKLDFGTFLQNTLVHEVQKMTPQYNILRRRAAILLAQWIPMKGSADKKVLVYQVFQHLLTKEGQPLNDLVVRVTAGRQLKYVVDEWEFNISAFLPYADTILTYLMQLIDEVELMETKMALLDSISVIVERLEHNITPFAGRIMNLLPPLWERSGEEHIMKQNILTILARLVQSMKAESLPLHAAVIPIIENAVKPDSETQVYLLEDAMDLWANIVEQTPSGQASSELLSLTQYLYNIYDMGSDSLRKALEIAMSYTLLAPEHMLAEQTRRSTFVALANLIGNLKADINGAVFLLLERTIRAAEALGGETAMSQTIQDLHTSGVMHKILTGLHGSWTAHCTTGPRAETPPVDGVIETDYFAVLARLILGSTTAFCEAVQLAAPLIDGSSAELLHTMKWLLEEWFSHFENIGDPARRKLLCLASTKLLETGQPWILGQLQLLMTMWTDIMRELYEDLKDQSGDSLVMHAPAPVEGPESPEDSRLRELTLSDVVCRIQTAEYIKHFLQQAVASTPGFQEEWLANVDKEVVKAFSELGIV